MQHPGLDTDERVQSPPILEIILIVTTLVFAICSLVWSTKVSAREEFRAMIIAGVPVILVLISLATRYSHLVWATSSLCLILGFLGMFSIGMPIFMMGLALILWYGVRSRRVSRAGDRWEGVLIFNIWLFPILFILVVLSGIGAQ